VLFVAAEPAIVATKRVRAVRLRGFRRGDKYIAHAHQQARERQQAADDARGQLLELSAAAIKVPGISLALLTSEQRIARQTLHEMLRSVSAATSAWLGPRLADAEHHDPLNSTTSVSVTNIYRRRPGTRGAACRVRICGRHSAELREPYFRSQR
jgi:hypothetical protein